MQSMINEQAAKAEELILTIVNQARVHCRRDTLWQRLQHQVTGGVLSHHHYQPQMTYTEFRELLTLSHSEPVSLSEPQQLVPLLAQPVSWYQGLAKLLLSRYPDTQRHFTSADGSAQYVVILNQRLPATAMMLSWDVHADRAVNEFFHIIVYLTILSSLIDCLIAGSEHFVQGGASRQQRNGVALDYGH